MNNRPEPKRPITKAVEALIQQYNITGFACTIWEDILLLAANILTIPASSDTVFIGPDYVRMTMTYKQLSKENAEKFFDFLRVYDNTVTLNNNQETHDMVFSLNCDTCLEKIVPVFKKIFLEKVTEQPDFLKPYQEASAPYFPLSTSSLSLDDELRQTRITSSAQISNVATSFFLNKSSPAENHVEISGELINKPKVSSQ